MLLALSVFRLNYLYVCSKMFNKVIIVGAIHESPVLF